MCEDDLGSKLPLLSFKLPLRTSSSMLLLEIPSLERLRCQRCQRLNMSDVKQTPRRPG